MPHNASTPPGNAASGRPIFPQMGFERYQRLLGIAEEIKAHAPAAPTVLDVGGHDAFLHKFIPCASYVEYNGLIVPGEAPLPYKSKSFDVVVAADVLEHVPQQDRDYFLKELVRVSRRLVIFSFPNPEALQFESMVMEYCPQHDWLLEHKAMGLPNPQDVQACLESCNARYTVKNNGGLCGWLCSYLLHLTLGEKRVKLNEFLQRNCYEHENNAPAYRAIYTVWTETARIGDEHLAQAARPSPQVSVIIPVYNQPEYTRHCLAALKQNTDRGQCEIIVVDNNSCQETQEAILGASCVDKFIRNATNRGFAAACNQGAQAAVAPYLVFLNNDTQTQPGWLEALVTRAQSSPAIGMVGSKLLYPDGQLQHCGVVIVRQEQGAALLPRHLFLGMPQSELTDRPMRLQAVTAACMLIDADLFQAVGGFDEGYWNGSEDIDLCFKVGRAGRSIVYEPASVVIHHESKSGAERHAGIRQNNALLQERWKDSIFPDLIQTGAQTVLGHSAIAALDGADAFSASYLQAARQWWERRNEPPRPHSTLNIAKFIVNSCAPTRQHQNWGDAAFAEHIAQELQKAGQTAQVAYAEEWAASAPSRFAVVIHLRGLQAYAPNPAHYNILWLISHPELVTEDELRGYDRVFCCSESHARTLAHRFNLPVEYLPQATSGDFLDFRHEPATQDIDVLFVGNNYCAREGKCRKIVQDFLQTGVACNFKVVGESWSGFVPPEAILAEYVPHAELPQLYARAKVSLNDHHPTMAAQGFINNRTFDLMALGAAQVSTPVDGLQALGVPTYASVDELRATVEALLLNGPQREAGAAQARKTAGNFTFARAVARMLDQTSEDILARCRDVAMALPPPAAQPLSRGVLEGQALAPDADQQALERGIAAYLRAPEHDESAAILGFWLFDRLNRHGYLRDPIADDAQTAVFLSSLESGTLFACFSSLLRQTQRSWRLHLNAETLDTLPPDQREMFAAFRTCPARTRGLGKTLPFLDPDSLDQLLDAEFLLALSPEVTLTPGFLEESMRILRADENLGYVTSALLRHGACNGISLPWEAEDGRLPAVLVRVSALQPKARATGFAVSELHDQMRLAALLRQGMTGRLLRQPLICLRT